MKRRKIIIIAFSVVSLLLLSFLFLNRQTAPASLPLVSLRSTWEISRKEVFLSSMAYSATYECYQFGPLVISVKTSE